MSLTVAWFGFRGVGVHGLRVSVKGSASDPGNPFGYWGGGGGGCLRGKESYGKPAEKLRIFAQTKGVVCGGVPDFRGQVRPAEILRTKIHGKVAENLRKTFFASLPRREAAAHTDSLHLD